MARSPPSRFDEVKYKLDAMQNWNTVAQEYHRSWAAPSIGPFRSTLKLVEAAKIKGDDRVLDLACGTGVVSLAVSSRLGPSGLLVGIDFSSGPLQIAKSVAPRGQFFRMDAEKLGLAISFDKVLCQYGLMFFPNSTETLKSVRGAMRPDGTLAVCVHGTPEGVPYFSTIMAPVVQCFPEIRPAGTPTVHRYGSPKDLKDSLLKAGFHDIRIVKFTFEYRAGTFEEYWRDYLATTGNAIRTTIERDKPLFAAVKKEAKRRSEKYAREGIITFPWDILIATAAG